MNTGLVKCDRTTRALHAALATSVVTQLALSAVMTVPAGPGLGVRDWHRAAFELHAKVGLFVAAICALHWIWIAIPNGSHQMRALFPWISRSNAQSCAQWKLTNHLAGTVHGLGLLAVSGAALCGIINYFGYFLGAPVPASVLHVVGRLHIAFGWLIGVFLVGHVTMACFHLSSRVRGFPFRTERGCGPTNSTEGNLS